MSIPHTTTLVFAILAALFIYLVFRALVESDPFLADLPDEQPTPLDQHFAEAVEQAGPRDARDGIPEHYIFQLTREEVEVELEVDVSDAHLAELVRAWSKC